MGRLVSIGGGNIYTAAPIVNYSLELTYKEHPKLLHLGTVTSNFHRQLQHLGTSYSVPNKEVRIFSLCKNNERQEIKRAVYNADLILLAEDNFLEAQPIWQKRRLGELLTDVYLQDSAVLVAVGACAIWRFHCGYQMADTGPQFVEHMLDFQHCFCCPWYEQVACHQFDQEVARRHLTGFALESNTAFVENTGTISFIKSVSQARAYQFTEGGRAIEKREVPCILV